MLITADKIGFVATDFLSVPAADAAAADADANLLPPMTNTRIWSEMPRSETHSTKVSKVYSRPGTSIGTRIRLLAILEYYKESIRENLNGGRIAQR